MATVLSYRRQPEDPVNGHVVHEYDQRSFSTLKSRPQVDWKSGEILNGDYSWTEHNRKRCKQTLLNITEDDAASSCLQSWVVSSGMTKHTAVFTTRQGRLPPSGSSQKLPEVQSRWGEDAAHLVWLEHGDEGDHLPLFVKAGGCVILMFSKNAEAGSKDTAQMHKHKNGSCTGAGQSVRHPAGSDKIHLSKTVCKYSIIQFPLLIYQD